MALARFKFETQSPSRGRLWPRVGNKSLSSLEIQPRMTLSSAYPKISWKEWQKRYKNSLEKKSKISVSVEKGTLESINDQGKLPLLPFNTLYLTKPYSPAFTTTPNHSEYGLMGQVSVLECRSYTWTKDKEHRLV